MQMLRVVIGGGFLVKLIISFFVSNVLFSVFFFVCCGSDGIIGCNGNGDVKYIESMKIDMKKVLELKAIFLLLKQMLYFDFFFFSFVLVLIFQMIQYSIIIISFSDSNSFSFIFDV